MPISRLIHSHRVACASYSANYDSSVVSGEKTVLRVSCIRTYLEHVPLYLISSGGFLKDSCMIMQTSLSFHTNVPERFLEKPQG